MKDFLGCLGALVGLFVFCSLALWTLAWMAWLSYHALSLLPWPAF